MMFLDAQGAAARASGERADPRRAGRRPSALEDDRRAARRPLAVEAAVARRSSEYIVPIGKAQASSREGDAASRSSATAARCRCASRPPTSSPSEGIDAEVIDLRTLFPYDWERSRDASQKTGRVLFVNEDTEVTNFGEHLLRRIVEEHFYELLAPPQAARRRARARASAWPTPWRWRACRSSRDITEAMRALAARAALTASGGASLTSSSAVPPCCPRCRRPRR